MQKDKKKVTRVEDLNFDNKNANTHSEYGSSLLENSLRHNGTGRSILISNDNVIIAGNGVAEMAGSLGLQDVQVVESDGTKIIAVKRTDIKSGTKEFHQMALADNIVALKNIVMDAEVVEAIVQEHPNVSFWSDIVLEPIDPKVLSEIGLPDADKANMVQVTFTLSGKQGADLNQAIKISKQLNKTKFAEQDNKNSNGNALYFIIQHYLKEHQNVKLDDELQKKSASQTSETKKGDTHKPFVSREQGAKVRANRKADKGGKNRRTKRK